MDGDGGVANAGGGGAAVHGLGSRAEETGPREGVTRGGGGWMGNPCGSQIKPLWTGRGSKALDGPATASGCRGPHTTGPIMGPATEGRTGIGAAVVWLNARPEPARRRPSQAGHAAREARVSPAAAGDAGEKSGRQWELQARRQRESGEKRTRGAEGSDERAGGRGSDARSPEDPWATPVSPREHRPELGPPETATTSRRSRGRPDPRPPASRVAAAGAPGPQGGALPRGRPRRAWRPATGLSWCAGSRTPTPGNRAAGGTELQRTGRSGRGDAVVADDR
nr:collagen alpha chain-like [Aegilops tauschii subsp. strangulata]